MLMKKRVSYIKEEERGGRNMKEEKGETKKEEGNDDEPSTLALTGDPLITRS